MAPLNIDMMQQVAQHPRNIAEKRLWIPLLPVVGSFFFALCIVLCHYSAVSLGYTHVSIPNYANGSVYRLNVQVPNISPTINRLPQYYWFLMSMVFCNFLYVLATPAILDVLRYFHSMQFDAVDETLAEPFISTGKADGVKKSLKANTLHELAQLRLHMQPANISNEKAVPVATRTHSNYALFPIVWPTQFFCNISTLSLYSALIGLALLSIIPLQADFLQNLANYHSSGVFGNLLLISKLHLISSGFFFFGASIHCFLIGFPIVSIFFQTYFPILRFIIFPRWTIMTSFSKFSKAVFLLSLLAGFLFRVAVASIFTFDDAANSVISRINCDGISQRVVVFSILGFMASYTIDLIALKFKFKDSK